MDPALAQVAREHERSAHWRAQIDRLRDLARGSNRGGYRNSTGRLDRCSWGQLGVFAEEGRRPGSTRARAHCRQGDTEADEGNRHVLDYLAGCRKYARSLGSVELGVRVHALVCGEGYSVDVTGLIADRPWQFGYHASAMAAHIHRRSAFGVGTAANRMVWERNRPRPVPLENLADPSQYRLPVPSGIGTLSPAAIGPRLRPGTYEDTAD